MKASDHASMITGLNREEQHPNVPQARKSEHASGKANAQADGAELQCFSGGQYLRVPKTLH
ncbi:MAG TPA: hypothetical protein VGK22_04275 [Candidatus Angelobacter sp.]|jgi:hypothetical protein